MSSRGKVNVITSPKSASGDSAGNSPKGTGQQQQQQQQQCLCSPTKHQGSFRCRFHRSASTAYSFKRSKSLTTTTTTTTTTTANNNNNNIITTSLKNPVEST